MKIRGLEHPIRVLLIVVKRPGLVGTFLSNFFANPSCPTSALLLLWLVTLLMSTTSTMVVSSAVPHPLAQGMPLAT